MNVPTGFRPMMRPVGMMQQGMPVRPVQPFPLATGMNTGMNVNVPMANGLANQPMMQRVPNNFTPEQLQALLARQFRPNGNEQPPNWPQKTPVRPDAATNAAFVALTNAKKSDKPAASENVTEEEHTEEEPEEQPSPASSVASKKPRKKRVGRPRRTIIQEKESEDITETESEVPSESSVETSKAPRKKTRGRRRQ